MSKNEYLVSTTMGSSLMKPHERVYVQITSSRFLEKTVGDLRPGELILFSKPYTKTDLEDVIPVLHKSPRYSNAREKLFDTNSQGEHIPRLRTQIIRGLAERGIVNAPDLEARILMEYGEDFTKAEYTRMEEYLLQALTVDGVQQIGRGGINNWLKGTVTAPRNWKLFSNLAEHVNPAFSEWKVYEDDPKSIYFNYRLYVVIHQGIMRFLNEAKGIHGDKDWQDGESKISLSPEYAIVFTHFMRDLSPDYATARVIGTQKVRGQRQIDILSHADKNIRFGIIRKSTGVQLQEKTYGEICEDEDILRAYIRAAAETFVFPSKNLLSSLKSTKARSNLLILSHELPFYLLESFGEELDAYAKYYCTCIVEQGVPDELEPYYHSAREGLLNGDMDEFHEFSRGTMMRAMEAFFRTRTAIPARVYECEAEIARANSQSGRRLGRRERRNLDLQRRNIESKYGISIGNSGGVDLQRTFFSSYARLDTGMSSLIELFGPLGPSLLQSSELIKEIGLEFILTQVDLLARQKIAKMNDQPQELSRFVKRVRDLPNPPTLYSREYTRSALKQYGLQDIVDLRKEDFYFERFTDNK